MNSFARNALASVALFSSAVVGVAVFSPSPADAQVSRCDQIRDRERRQRCRSAEYDAQRYREEERTWREAERDIRGHHRNGCRAVGYIGQPARIGGAARAACEGPRIIYDARERRRARGR